ncbi:hypothetical protein NE236_31025 [Actinoallomurus purpureus]|uniref:hypothetical protein n=1 Tax=Actinoallomurus purpureus TaxID=478114 RepID=UPI0020924B05|nr:hypothetical protein [Actinoallomurus purpureus]MCO6009413.1 hypothetical protein [Actinoallomurus purpureus]
MSRADRPGDGRPEAEAEHFRTAPRAVGAVTLAGGVALLAAAGWFGVWTVRTTDGPWGSPGRAGTLTVAQCRTSHPSGGDGPTMMCTGTFVPDGGGSSVPAVSLRLDSVRGWASGERIRVRLRPDSRTAYRPGGHDWISHAFVFVVLIFFAAIAIRGSFQRHRVEVVSESREERSSA